MSRTYYPRSTKTWGRQDIIAVIRRCSEVKMWVCHMPLNLFT